MKRLLMPLLFGLIPAALPAAAKADGYYGGRGYDSCRYEYRGDGFRSAGGYSGAYCDRGPVVVYRYTPYDAGCYRDTCDRGYTVARRYEDRGYDRGRVEYRYGR